MGERNTEKQVQALFIYKERRRKSLFSLVEVHFFYWKTFSFFLKNKILLASELKELLFCPHNSFTIAFILVKSSSAAAFFIHKLPSRDYSLWSLEVDDNLILVPSEWERKFSTKGSSRTRNSSKRERWRFFYPVF